MNKNIILNFILLLIASVNTFQKQWTAQELNKYSSDHKYPSFVDPENYVESDKMIEEINNVIESIYSKKKFDTYVFIIPQISDKYSSFLLGKDIELFLNDLSYLVLDGDISKDKNSCFILFSIEDKLMRIRTGENVKYYISDDRALNYIRKIKNEMRSYEYGAAAKKLLDLILDRLVNSNPYLENIIKFTFIIAFIIGGCFLFIRSVIVENRKYYLTPTAKQRLDKIKKISDLNPTKKEFVETTCVICLEELGRNKDIESNIQKEDKQVSLCEVSTLECGHSFHSNCIATWMDKSNNCPTCRHKIDEDGNTRKVAEGLVLVQTAYHPNLANYNYNYNDGFAWNRHHNTTGNYGGSSYSSNWGISGGGATSSW